MMEKDKNNEIRRLARDRERDSTGLAESVDSRVRSLQEEIKLKDERYRMLLDQLNTFQGDASRRKPENSYEELKVMFESLLSAQNLSKSQSLDKNLEQKIIELASENQKLNEENRRLNEDIKRLQHLLSEQKHIVHSPPPQPAPVIVNNDKNEMFIETIKSLLEKVTNVDRNVSDESVKRDI